MGSKGGETYDSESLDSIIGYARLLIGKSLAEASDKPRESYSSKGKGGLGTLVEEVFFDMRSSNKPKPDFGKVSLELKTTAMIWRTVEKNKVLVAKERLVLSMLDYEKIVEETWETSRLLLKCRLMLILTYLYERELDPVDRVFLDRQKLLDLLDPDSVDASQFKRDWETIKERVNQGKAHELSSGDTLYLEAITKGQGKGKDKPRPQPFSSESAKPRAFAIKQSYLTVLLGGEGDKNVLLTESEESFESATQKRFAPFLGKTVSELAVQFGLTGSPKSYKAFHRSLAVKILAQGGSSVPELQKADIELKVVRLRKSGSLREAVSFPNFKYLDLVEEEWEDSNFFERLNRRILFIAFQEDDSGDDRLKTYGYWSMPYSDKLEAQKVWEQTKKLVLLDKYDFPKSSENPVAHVRPKGPNSKATYPTPFGGEAKRYCFWLNRDYVQKVIESLVIET